MVNREGQEKFLFFFCVLKEREKQRKNGKLCETYFDAEFYCILCLLTGKTVCVNI